MEIKNIQGLRVSEIKQLVNQGGKFVVFPYTISLVLLTFKRNSSIYFIRPNEKTIGYSYKHVGVNFVMGWWSIPWGPIYTIGSMYTQLTGGKDLTPEVLSHLIQHDPEADTTTYAINGMVNGTQETATETPTYNIPR